MPVKRAAGFLMVRTKGKAFLLSWGFVAGKISYYNYVVIWVFICRLKPQTSKILEVSPRRKVELSRLSGMIGQIFDVEHLGGGQMVFKLPE
jgi:hypothetical protein